MTRIAVVGHRSAPDADPTDLCPDPDQAALLAALVARGIEATPVSWDADVPWRSFDAAVIRSTWDSVDRPETFLRWARAASVQTMLLNPCGAIEWSLDKTYLAALAGAGVHVDRLLAAPREVAVAERVLDAARTLIGAELLYARVDLVTGPDGAPCLAELEIIDPVLHLGFEPRAADRLAAAIEASLAPVR